MKTKFSIKQVSDDLRREFGFTDLESKSSSCVNEEKLSRSLYVEDEDGIHFMIDKRQMERREVIKKLVKYFDDKVIDNGCCNVGSITFVWTAFHIYTIEQIVNLNKWRLYKKKFTKDMIQAISSMATT